MDLTILTRFELIVFSLLYFGVFLMVAIACQHCYTKFSTNIHDSKPCLAAGCIVTP